MAICSYPWQFVLCPGEVEEQREQASNTADEAPMQVKGVVKTNRPTAKSRLTDPQGSSSSIIHSRSSASVPETVDTGTEEMVPGNLTIPFLPP